MSGHGAKRQRLTGSFSPASPPYHLAAKPSETKTPVVHPNTPTSPPYSSMNSQPNGGPPMTATPALAVMTPPSSVTMSQRQFSPPGPSATNPPPVPTPASTSGHSHSINIDSDGDATMEDSQDDDTVRLGVHRRSNHNRQNEAIFSVDGGVAAAKGVCGSQLFKLCQSTVQDSRPHASQNLFELYNLDSLARSVARTDPVTGEKINKLRKSYEGHIKSLQIAGKPKAVKMDGKLSTPVAMNDQDWISLNVTGKEIHTALSSDGENLNPDYSSLLDSAFAGLAPGPLPPKDTAIYRAYLGTDDAIKSKAGPEVAPYRLLPSASATPNPHTPATAPAKSRPERLGSKRQYTDASFHGYGEGYVDDYAESTGGEDNAQGNMKRRKLAFERAPHQVEVGGVRR